MKHESFGALGVNYAPCRYAHSKLNFRGPKRSLDQGYIACIGDGATYGKFVRTPFPAMLEQELGRKCVNLGIPHAGIDAFVKDASVMSICEGADAVVLQVSEVQNMSNRFYRVHPRRNDRFIAASSVLKVLFPNIDFTEFDFTRHLLARLRSAAPEKFGIVEAELAQAWTARMRTLLSHFGDRAVIVSVPPMQRTSGSIEVNSTLLSGFKDIARDIVEVRPLTANTIEGMECSAVERDRALCFPNPRIHAEICEAVAAKLLPRLQTKKARTVFARASGGV